MPVDHANSARDLAKLAQQVPSLPLTFQRINDLVSNPQSTTAQMAEAISTDQGLVTRILRLSNSSFYGLPARVDTITQAVSLIGTRQLRDLALATAVLDLFKDIPNQVLDGEKFWEYALAIGTATRLIATKRGERQTARHFVTGMLHDIGLVVMAQQIPEKFQRIFKAPPAVPNRWRSSKSANSASITPNSAAWLSNTGVCRQRWSKPPHTTIIY